MKGRAKSVEEILHGLPKWERLIVERLRGLILECLPKATEKVSYGAPFYSHHKMICFIWPPSIYWSPTQQPGKHHAKGVSLGFCYGNKMANENGVLAAEGRKQVYCIYFKSLTEINETLIRSLLYEAGMIDDAIAQKQKKTTRKTNVPGTNVRKRQSK